MSALEGRVIQISDNEKTRKLGIAGKKGLIVEQMRNELLVRVNGLPVNQKLSRENVELEPLRGRLFLTKKGQQVIVNKIFLVDPLARPPEQINRFLPSAWERRYKAVLSTPVNDGDHLVDTINGFELTGLMDNMGNWILDYPSPNRENPLIFDEVIPENE